MSTSDTHHPVEPGGAGRRRVAILGGGVGAIAAAWALSDPAARERVEITVYQLGWRLGGKGASGRNAAQAQRIEERTNFDIELLKETGICSGIENYSRYLSGLKPGEPPYTLMDYFGDDFLIIVDESHKTVPQIRSVAGVVVRSRSRQRIASTSPIRAEVPSMTSTMCPS